jgi:hypothetical protein
LVKKIANYVSDKELITLVIRSRVKGFQMRKWGDAAQRIESSRYAG